MTYGLTLSSEEHGPSDLVRNAQRAEDAGFGFVSLSDHFHPWLSAQGHSPFEEAASMVTDDLETTAAERS